MPYERPYSPTEAEHKAQLVDRLGDEFAASAYALQAKHTDGGVGANIFALVSLAVARLEVEPSPSQEEAFNKFRTFVLNTAQKKYSQ